MKCLSPFFGLFLLLNLGCANMQYTKAVPKVELAKFMKRWYVIAGRVTFLESGAHNAVEEYTYNSAEKRIDINFYFNQDTFDGKKKTITQKAWIVEGSGNAKWKVSPLWPLKFNYSVIALADDYSWVVIGVPSQDYVWIMAHDWQMDEAKLQEILSQVQRGGYSVRDVKRIPQRW